MSMTSSTGGNIKGGDNGVEVDTPFSLACKRVNSMPKGGGGGGGSLKGMLPGSSSNPNDYLKMMQLIQHHAMLQKQRDQAREEQQREEEEKRAHKEAKKAAKEEKKAAAAAAAEAEKAEAAAAAGSESLAGTADAQVETPLAPPPKKKVVVEGRITDPASEQKHQQQDQADRLKAQGNAAMKAKSYVEAVGYYSGAIAAATSLRAAAAAADTEGEDHETGETAAAVTEQGKQQDKLKVAVSAQTLAVLHSNRCAAYMSAGNHEEALFDALLCVQLR